MQMRVRVLLVALVILAPRVVIGQGALTVGTDRGSGAVTASLDAQPLIRMEALQLVNTDGGWKVVYATGTGGQAAPLTQGTVNHEEQREGVIDLSKTVTVEGGALTVALTYRVPAGVAADRNYYFLDIPMEAVAGGVLTTTGAEERTVVLEPGSGSGALASALTGCTLLTEDAELTFELEAENAEWLFMDWTTTEHESYRLRIERAVEPEGFEVSLKWKLTAKASTPERLAAEVQRLEAEREREREERLRALRMTEAEPLALRDVDLSAEAVAVYEKLELTLDLVGTWDNPFDPREIDVTAQFRSPSGRETSVPGFLCQEHRHTDAGEETAAAPVWMVRYSPTEEGHHECMIAARDRTGEVESEILTFTATPARSEGHVRVSDESPLYFEFDSGRPYFPIGANHFTSTKLGSPLPPSRLPDMERYLTGLADGGANYVRLRMDSWWYSIENPPDDATGYLGVGKFHQPTAWGVDRLFDLAEERNVGIQLCMYNPNGNINNPREPWRQVYNFFMREHGGPLDDIAEFWTDPECNRLVKQKLRYCVARWGYSRALMAWEFFNEVVIREETAPEITAWHDEMSTYLRGIDPWDHLITTSPMGGSFEASAGVWELPNIDIVQVHSYEFTDMGAGLPAFCRDAIEAHGKPFIAGEFGLPQKVIQDGGHRLDAEGLHLHNGIWASALSGSAGSAMHWYITSYIDPNNLYPRFQGLSRFMAHMPVLSGDLAPANFGALRYVSPPEPEVFADVTLKGRPAFQRAEASRFVVGPTGEVGPPEQLNGYLWGVRAHQDLRNPPTFVVSYRRPGRFVLRVLEVVGNGEGPTRVYLDGELAVEENLAAGEGLGESSEHIEQYDNWRVTYNRGLTVAVPAGEHEIRCEHAGTDRAQVSYRLEGYVSNRDVVPLRVVGLANANSAYLWLQNTHSTFEALREGAEAQPAPPTELEVNGMEDGTYEVEFWDTVEGEVTSTVEAQAADGTLTLRLPEVATDVACIARRR